MSDCEYEDCRDEGGVMSCSCQPCRMAKRAKAGMSVPTQDDVLERWRLIGGVDPSTPEPQRGQGQEAPGTAGERVGAAIDRFVADENARLPGPGKLVFRTGTQPPRDPQSKK